jgi:hypothetical protein
VPKILTRLRHRNTFIELRQKTSPVFAMQLRRPCQLASVGAK